MSYPKLLSILLPLTLGSLAVAQQVPVNADGTPRPVRHLTEQPTADINTPPPNIGEILRHSNGSLYRASAQMDDDPRLIKPSDVNYFAVPEPIPKTLVKHDLVTIVVNEESETSSEGTTDLKKDAGIEMLHVPYQGIGPAIAAALGGHVDVIFAAPTIKSHTDAGALRPLATTGKVRNRDFPNLPTLAEAGLPDMVVSIWWGILAPAGTPEPVLNKLRAAVADILQDKSVLDGMRKLGYDSAYMPHDQFRAFVVQDMEQWGRAAKSANIVVE